MSDAPISTCLSRGHQSVFEDASTCVGLICQVMLLTCRCYDPFYRLRRFNYEAISYNSPSPAIWEYLSYRTDLTIVPGFAVELLFTNPVTRSEGENARNSTCALSLSLFRFQSYRSTQ
jgi:hypothetical protein